MDNREEFDVAWFEAFVDLCQRIDNCYRKNKELGVQLDGRLDALETEIQKAEHERVAAKEVAERIRKGNDADVLAIKQVSEEYVRDITAMYRERYDRRRQVYFNQKRKVNDELSRARHEMQKAKKFYELLVEFCDAKKRYKDDYKVFQAEYPWHARYATWEDVKSGGEVKLKIEINVPVKQRMKQLLSTREKEPDWERLPVIGSWRRYEKMKEVLFLYISYDTYGCISKADARLKGDERDLAVVSNELKTGEEKYRLKARLENGDDVQLREEACADYERKLVAFRECEGRMKLIEEESYLEQAFKEEFMERLGGDVTVVDVNACRRRLAEGSKRACVEDFLLHNSFPKNPHSAGGKKQMEDIVRAAIERLQMTAASEIRVQEDKQAECVRGKSGWEAKVNEALAEYERAISNATEAEALMEITESLRNQNPGLYPVWLQEVTEADVASYISTVKRMAEGRVCCRFLPVGYIRRTIGKCFMVPEYVHWCDPVEGCYNFEFDVRAGQYARAVREMNSLLMTMLLAYPVKKLNFTFVDLGLTNAASLFTTNIDSRLFHGNPIVDEMALNKRLDELNGRIVSKQYENLMEFNRQHHAIRVPYEVIVLLDFPGNLSAKTIDRLNLFFHNGYKGGIFFVVLRDIGEQNPKEVEAIDPYCFIPLPVEGDLRPEETLNHYVRVTENSILFKACVDYVNTEAGKVEKEPALVQEMKGIYNAPWEDAVAEFRVPVGEENGLPVYFELDEVSHVHAFVMGKSGSGKSVFLHDVLNNALLRYSPETLQLYVLDFKLGGVEFNRYRGINHIRALLVDHSDEQITLEILRDLYQNMQKRGKLLREAGVSNIKEYNLLNPERKLPRIILLADECHELFKEYADRSVQRDVNEIITKIAKEGRSQGVHLLLATQTLANAVISGEILANITDSYLLACVGRDAEKLVSNSGKVTEGLLNGQVLYGHGGERLVFKAYYADSARLEQNIEEVRSKGAGCGEGDQFFFSGKQNFPLVQSVTEEASARIRRYPACLLGRSVDVKLQPVGCALKAGLSENMLLFGINTEEQTSRVALNALITLMLSSRKLQKEMHFYIINCLAEEEERPVLELIWELEKYGCTLVEGSGSGALIARLGEDVREQKASPSVVLVLGQERFRELRLDLPVPGAERPVEEVQPASKGFLGDLGSFGRGRVEKRTYRAELRYLLENGSGQDVHFLWQVDKPGKLLFEDVITPQGVSLMFKHVVMLHSSAEASMKLRLPDNIKLDHLSKDNERLRAYYYYDEAGTYTLFTPYLQPSRDELSEILNLKI